MRSSLAVTPVVSIRARARSHARALMMLVVWLPLLATIGANLFHPQQTAAATSNTVNFQARLETAGGAIVPDGTYNVEFKLYNASGSSGSSQGSCTGDANCLWTEKYQNSASQGVTVINGYLTVNLGSVTPFSSATTPINWDQQLWLSMNIGGTSTGASPTYDGEMTPKLKLTASPYAFRAGQLADPANSGSVLSWANQSTANSILLPNEAGTLCIQSSTNCGFATSSGSGNYIQNSTGGPQAANFNIQSAAAGSVGGAIQGASSQTADLFDLKNSAGSVLSGFTAAGALQGGNATAGNTNTTGRDLILSGGQGTGNASGGNISFQIAKPGSSGSTLNAVVANPVFSLSGTDGSAVFKNAVNSTSALQVQTSSGGVTLSVDTSNRRVTVGASNGQQGLTLGAGLGIGSNLAVACLSATPSSSGGSLATNTYYYQITALDGAGGESAPGCELNASVTGPNGKVTLSYLPVSGGATSYRIYRGTSSGAENAYYTTTSSSFVDTGAANTVGAPPTTTTAYAFKVNPSGNSYFNGGNVGIGTATPAQTLNVAGTTLLQSTSNSAAAFQVQDSSGNNYIQADTNGANLYLGNTGIASTVQIGNSTGGVTQGINIGTNATAGSTTNVLIGSTVAGSTTLQNAGSISLNAPAITTNATTLSLFNTTPTTINFGGNVGSGGINLAGGSGSTGCTIDGSTGNLTCTGTISGTNTGSAGGDLTGTYPNPTIAKLQNNTLTISSIASGDVLQYSGSAIVNGKLTNANLQAGSFGSIQGVGALASGSIASGFGTISTGNNITTTTAIQGSTVNATSTLQLNGNNINTAGTLSNVAYLNATSQTFAGTNTFTGSGDSSTVAGSGVLFKNTTNATNAFEIQNAAGTSNLLIADTQNSRVGLGIASITTAGSGLLQVGASGSTTAAQGISFGGDTAANLYRSASGNLKTDGSLTIQGNQLTFGAGPTLVASSATSPSSLQLLGGEFFVVGSSATSQAYCSAINTDPNCRLQIRTDGLLQWGSGTGAADTNLYRSAASTLKTDGTLNVVSGYQINGTAGATTTCSGGQFLQNQMVVGGIVTGGTCATASGGSSGINNSTALQTAANFHIQSAATGSITGQLQAISSQTADLLDFENSSGTVLSGFTAAGALQGGNGSGTDATGTNLVLNGGQGTGAGNGGNINFQIAKAGSTGTSLNGLATVFSLSGASGAALFQSSTNSSTAFQIQNSAGNNYLQADTQNAILSLGNTGIASTVQIGNTSGAVTQNINIGANATASSTTNVTIGSTVAGSTTLQNATSIGLNAPSIDSNATTVGLFNTGVTTLSIGNAIGSGGLNLAGGFASNGCTIDGTNGNLSCTGTVNGQTISNAASFTGSLTVAGLLTGNAGATVSGGAISLNDSSNFNTGINSGTSTGTVSIGNAASGLVSIQGGSAGINLGTANASNTIQIGNTANAVTQIINLGNNATAGSTTTTTIGSTIGTSATTVQAGTGNINLVTNNTAAGTTVKTNTNSQTAFQIQNAAGAAILNVDTTSIDANNAVVNYLKYPGFESGSFSNAAAGWNAVSPGSLSQNTSKGNAYNGMYSAALTNTSGNNGGITTSSFNSAPPAGNYFVSFYAKISTGTMASTAFTISSAGGSGTCASYNTVTLNTSGFQRVYCTLAVASGSITGLTISQNDGAARTIYIDAVQLQSTTFNGAVISAPSAYQIGGIMLRGVIQNPLILQPNSDSTNIFQINNAAGTNSLLTADTVNNTVSLASSNTATSLLSLVNNSVFTGTGSASILSVASSGATTGNLVNLALSGTAQSTATALNVVQTNSATSYIGNLVNFTGSGTTGTGNVLQVTSVNTTSGAAINVSSNALTTGYAVKIGSTSTGLSSGGLLSVTANSAATATGGILQVSGNALTTGIGINVTHTSSTAFMTSGSLIQASSTANDTFSTGGLAVISSTGNFTSTANTAGLLNVKATNSAAGTLVNIANSYASQSTSTLLNIAQTGVTSTFTGNVVNFTGSSTSGGGNLLNLGYTAATTGAALKITTGAGASSINLANSGSIVDLASGTSGNTAIFKIASATTCASGSAQGLIFQATGGTQVGHLCTTGTGSLNYYGTFSTNGATDVAENYSDVNDNLSPGDVVALDTTSGVTKGIVKADANHQNILGVISTDPGVLLSGIKENGGVTDLVNPKPVALNGRIPTKVSTQNGPIAVGDYLVMSSTPGVAMKATGPGLSIGRALAAYSGNGVGSIEVFAQTQFYPGPTNTSYLQNGQDASFDNLAVSGNTGLNNLSVTGSALLTNLNVSGQATIHNLTVTGNATVGSLTVQGDASIGGSLTVAGPVSVGDITVNGHIITAGGQPTMQMQTALGSGTNAAVSVSGTDSTGTITITTGSNPNSGSLADIIFSKTYGQAPHVVLSASNDKAAALRFFKGNTSTTDFMFNSIDKPQANTTYVFDYFIAQ